MINFFRLNWPFLFLFLLLATWFYSPVFFEGKTPLHNDTVKHALAMLDYHKQVLLGDYNLLWTSNLYGGHPIMAESQGAFFNPLNVLIAYLFDPVIGQNLYHWLAKILVSIGAYCLCRFYGISRTASAFGAVAFAWSTILISFQSNLTLGAAIIWYPWSVLAMAWLLDKPMLSRAVPLGILMALLILSGYPHFFHGAVLYFVCMTAPQLVGAFSSAKTQAWIKSFVVAGLLAVLICIALSAVQWLPLLELAGHSHRADGTALFSIPLGAMFRSLIFANLSPALDRPTFYGAGSLLFCVVLSCLIFVRAKGWIWGHIVGVCFLFFLSLGAATPAFTLLLETGVIPGLDKFRLAYPYMPMAVLGMAVLSARAIDGLLVSLAGGVKSLKGISFPVKFKLLMLTVFWGLVLVFGFHESNSVLQIYAVVIALFTSVVMFALGKSQYIALVLLVCLIGDAVVTRLNVFAFYPNSDLSVPSSVRHLQQVPDIDEFNVLDVSDVVGYIFMSPSDLGVRAKAKQLVGSLTTSSNLRWGIASTAGGLALPMQRQVILGEKMRAEIKGALTQQPGLRLIDILGVKYVAVNDWGDAPGFERAFEDSALRVKIMENTHALPRFQFYTEHHSVASSLEARDYLLASEQRILVLEAEGEELDVSSSVLADSEQVVISPTLISDVEYRVSVDFPVDGWLFLADANYPGWTASVDGVEQKVFSAQVLGKAVQVQAGRHEVVISYRSKLFELGLIVSAVTLLVLMALSIRVMNTVCLGGGRRSKAR